MDENEEDEKLHQSSETGIILRKMAPGMGFEPMGSQGAPVVPDVVQDWRRVQAWLPRPRGIEAFKCKSLSIQILFDGLVFLTRH